VSITVRDFGPGLADDHLPELAQPFYRPEAARTRESGGVGLGLYLCKLVALAHAGSFGVENAHPGLRVCVTLQPEAALH
jgi:signal transduction histidine kinase